MKRSLIAFQALLASSAVLCQTVEASSTYTAPEQLNGQAKANSIEARIEAVRNTDWSSLLQDPEIEGELIAKSKWKNGKGKKFGNSYGKGKWNSDFEVDQPYRSFKLFFTADSRDPSSYPFQAFLKFSDGSNRKVADEQLQPPVGTGRMFGPFPQVPGKSISQVNFRIGANNDPAATGFSYRISVQGCH